MFVCFLRPSFAGERIPTLYEALDVCKELDLIMFLELKEDPEKVTLYSCQLLKAGSQ